MECQKKQKHLFKCDTCATILLLQLEDPEEIQDVREDKILLECPCGGICLPLRN